MMLTVDPLAANACALTVGAVLAGGGLAKLRDPAAFRQALDQYAILPEVLLSAFGWGFAAFELLAGVLLLWPSAVRTPAGALAAGLLVLASGGVLINLLRGRTRIDCGCGGSGYLPLSGSLLARNACLIGLALALAAPVDARAQTWFDVAGAVIAALLLLGLYAICNQLLMNHSLSDHRRTLS